MRLNDFIHQNMEAILVQWESFAATCIPAAIGMSGPMLRDQAQQILEAVVKDISAPQSVQAQGDKSKGLIGKLPGALETAAETHGLLRAMSGFEIDQMVSEYRALRASVLKLWMTACQPATPDLNDMIRFNEAIDQALAESISYFNQKVEESHNLFLGTLGHDMRAPLQAIQMTAHLLDRINAGETVSKAARRLMNSGTQMKTLLDDLLEFNQVQLGVGLCINPKPEDLSILFNAELDNLRAAYPEQVINLIVEGPTEGVWDGASLRRLLCNLVVNAIKYGEASSPIVVRVIGLEDQIKFEVRDKGTPHDTITLKGLFDPLKQGLTSKDKSNGSLGLGLYIASQVAKAHNGTIGASCENGETVFAVQLPVNSYNPESDKASAMRYERQRLPAPPVTIST